jgi:hypothetical protein
MRERTKDDRPPDLGGITEADFSRKFYFYTRSLCGELPGA